MVNFFVQMPYEQEGMSKRFLVDKDHLKLIQVGLRPGQGVPQHTTRGDVHILALQGKVVINPEGVDAVADESRYTAMNRVRLGDTLSDREFGRGGLDRLWCPRSRRRILTARH